MQQSPEYWVGKTENPDQVLGDAGWIADFNRRSFASDPHLVDLMDYPDTVPGPDLARLIDSVSRPGDAPLYYRNDPARRALEPADYERYAGQLGLDRIADVVPVRFGLIIHRTNMRSWPTRDFVIRSEETRDLDRFQENALFPGELVAVLHESTDGEWVFVRSYNYHAWIRKIRLVTGPRRAVMDYASARPFLVVTGARAATNYNPVDQNSSELQLDMGVRLPVLPPEEMPAHVDGQNPVASFAVRFPVRDEKNELGFRTVLIGRGQDVREGYLDYTRGNVIRQAFKFLGERYGWGHSYNARDCTGLVLDVYRTMGIVLPRNSGQQGASPIGKTVRIPESDGINERMAALEQARAGDLVYAPGHVMIFLGFDEGEPWVIHHMSGSGWVDERGKPIEGIMNGVAATAINRTEMIRGKTFFETMYAIKKLE
ncbi:MAG: SH3 domain-containing protein [Xanthomonadales bacterium]|jgi:hypothetical protein|nr:SH3 domain-containing protein [Xanthomonadales bacterium]